MKKERIKGWLGLIGTLLILLYIGCLYPLNGFTVNFGLALFSGMLAVPSVILASYRRVGSLPAWATLAAAFPILYIATRDLATAVLVWALVCGSPLAVTFGWPYYKKVLPLTSHALPLSGLIWMGGTFVYAKLHFGGWGLYAVTARIAERYGAFVGEMEALYQQLYQSEMPKQLQDAFDLMHTQAEAMGFYLIMMTAYALMGAYFLGIWIADRSVKGAGGWLGSWAALIPGRGISWIYMLIYVAVQFFGGEQIATWLAVIYLFGFFFVFTGIYWLLSMMRKKNWSGAVQFLLVAAMLILSYCTAGGSFLSPYTILLYLGWWIVTLPRVQKK